MSRIIDADKLHYKRICIESEKGMSSDVVVFAKEIDKLAKKEPMDLQTAYKMVFEDMTREDGCSLFRGRYDARHGNEHYMYGISAVLENIAIHVSDEVYEKFSDDFIHNMIESEQQYGDVTPEQIQDEKELIQEQVMNHQEYGLE